MKKLFALILCLSFLLVPCLTAHAATASVSASEVSVGNTVKVTFTFKESKAIGSVDLIVQFDEAHLEYKSYTGSLGGSMANPQGGTVKISEYNGSNTSTTYTAAFTFTAKAVGSAVVSVTSCDIGDQEGLSIDTSSASATVTIKAQQSQSLSSVCTLKSLTPPAGCTLSPKFSPNTTSYTCSVPYTVDKFPLDWVATDSKATVKASGSVALNVGTNTRSVRVTAQDGTTKTYTVSITRAAQEGQSATPAPTPATTAQADIPVIINEESRSLSREMHIALPTGFTLDKLTYLDEEVECGVLGGVRVVQINNGEEADLYFYDEEERTFGLFRTVQTMGETYSVLGKIPDRLPLLSMKRLVKNLPCFSLPALGDGYYLATVLRHSTGEEYLAVYCEADNTLQKVSEELLGEDLSARTTEVPSPTATVSFPAQPLISYNWPLINTLVVVVILLVLYLVISLILLIVRSRRSRPPRDPDHDWNLDASNPYNLFIAEEELNDEAPVEPEPEPVPEPRRRARRRKHDWGLPEEEQNPFNIVLKEEAADEIAPPAPKNKTLPPEDEEHDFE